MRARGATRNADSGLYKKKGIRGEKKKWTAKWALRWGCTLAYALPLAHPFALKIKIKKKSYTGKCYAIGGSYCTRTQVV